MPVYTNISRDFLTDVGLGRVPGFQPDLVTGLTPPLNTNDGNVTIWDQNTPIQFLTVETELFISSSSALDVGNIAIVRGVDGNYDEKLQQVTLNGQNEVSAGNFLIIQSVVLINQINVGDVYIHTGGSVAGVPVDLATVQSKIIIGKGITHNAWYVVPNGKAAILYVQRATTDANNKSAIITTRIRPVPTAPFLETVSYAATPSIVQFDFPVPIGKTNVGGVLSIVRPEKSLVEWRALVATNGTTVFFGADLVLVPRSEIE